MLWIRGERLGSYGRHELGALESRNLIKRRDVEGVAR